jgi:hypothetical protein
MEDRRSMGGYSSASYGSEGMSRSTHRGKGPKDYRRSDDRIREDISDRLADDDRVDASNIEVQVSNSEVTLTGNVDNREAKRRAEDLAEQVSGVQHVQNNIRVQREGASTSRTGSSSSLGSTGSTERTGSSELTGTTGASTTGTQGAGSSGPGSSSGMTSSGKTSSGTTGKDKQ